MIYKRVEINIDYQKLHCIHDEYHPYADCYIHSQSPEIHRGKKRTAMIVCPGGAYYFN